MDAQTGHSGATRNARLVDDTTAGAVDARRQQQQQQQPYAAGDGGVAVKWPLEQRARNGLKWSEPSEANGVELGS